MGGQGVGKGTFSKMLMARGDYMYIETGAILRTAPADSDIGRMVARGELVPDDMLFKLISDRINSCKCDIILDGFPRTLSQAKWLVGTYASTYDIHVIYLNVSMDILLQRINKRIREGGNRPDDADATIIRRRLDTFRTQTIPAIQWLGTVPDIQFTDIDATGTADENFAEIMAALNT